MSEPSEVLFVVVGRCGAETVRRMEVPGGWIYAWDLGTEISARVVFVPRPVEGQDAPHHVCGHGYAARTCGLCERDGMFR